MKPTIGRIVHFVLPNGQHRPGIVVHNWPGNDPPGGLVQLQVFTDSDADGRYNDQLPAVSWRTSIKQDEETMAPGTWHWPERED
jgi:hypothetical protein